jgi:hypothetical protein
LVATTSFFCSLRWFRHARINHKMEK